MDERNTAIPPDVQAAEAEKHGVTLDGAVPVSADGAPLHELDLTNIPAGLKVDYQALPDTLLASIEEKAAVPDHTLPPHVSPSSPEAVEYEAARSALEAAETATNDPGAPTPSQDEKRAIVDRFIRADAWLQKELAAHRRSVQVAHGIPIGDDQTGVVPSPLPAISEV